MQRAMATSAAVNSRIGTQFRGASLALPRAPVRHSRTQGGSSRVRPGVTMAAAAAQVVAEVVYEATGVPMVDELMSLKSVDEAIAHSVRLIAYAAVSVVAGALILKMVDKVLGGKLSQSGAKFNIVGAAVASAFKPSQVLLPFYGVAYMTTVVSSLAQVAATKLKSDFATLCGGKDKEIMGGIKVFTQLVQDTSELILIIAAAWAVNDFKNRLVSFVQGSILNDKDTANDGLARLLTPISNVLSFCIGLAAAMTALSAYGINIGPIIASVGGAGVIVGLAAQSLMQNIASAVTLYTARPFIVGDRVQLLAAGALVVEGEVAQIEPMRTIIRTEDGSPVYINNAEVTGYMIKNLSQKPLSGEHHP